MGSMNVPTLSPGKRGNDVVNITTTWGISGVRAAEHEAPGHEQRLEQHARRQLRLTLPPLDEDDRHFAYPKAEPLRVVEHLDEKRVALRDHPGDRDPRERLAAPAAETARAVARREIRDEPDVAIAERAEKDAMQR